MKFYYSKWYELSQTSDEKLQKLLNLFSYLLVKSNGDPNQAIKWLSRLDEKYIIFDDSLSFQDFIDLLLEKGLIREEKEIYFLTDSGKLQIRKDSFSDIFGNLKKFSEGMHEVTVTGKGTDKTEISRKYQFGDQPYNINITQTLSNSLIKNGLDEFLLSEEDIEIFETEHLSQVSTVLLIDISHSMILYGEDRITPAKQVALALCELILSKYRKDSLEVVVFGDTAEQINISEIPFIKVGPFHTNLKAGIQLARHLLKTHKNKNKQIFIITDGKPSAITEKNSGRIYKNSWGLDPKIVNHTFDEALACRREHIAVTTFMIADDPYLINFIKEFTSLCCGKAYYSTLNELGQFVLSNYIKSRHNKEN
ncbi:MAG: VWA domain-containing protein [Ignavibacteria bacterium]|nr:VWA domain-containing protein [Ignavibacteria bacterium]